MDPLPCCVIGTGGSAMPMNHPPDDRSRQAIAYHWSSKVISVALEMVLPGLLGYWLDQKLGTRVVLTVAGFGFGLVMGIYHLVQMTRPKDHSGVHSPAGSEASGKASKERK